VSDVQPAPVPASPLAGPTPQPYLDGPTCQAQLALRYPRYSLAVTPGEGDMLVASMALDEEGPFYGVKESPTNEREWPRSFATGWPNVVATPSPLLISRAYPGAWYLNYEGVVPQQVLDWVCLEVWRNWNLDQARVVTRESVSGASGTYAPSLADAKGETAQLDLLQARLISPFLMRDGHDLALPFWDGM